MKSFDKTYIVRFYGSNYHDTVITQESFIQNGCGPVRTGNESPDASLGMSIAWRHFRLDQWRHFCSKKVKAVNFQDRFRFLRKVFTHNLSVYQPDSQCNENTALLVPLHPCGNLSGAFLPNMATLTGTDRTTNVALRRPPTWVNGVTNVRWTISRSGNFSGTWWSKWCKEACFNFNCRDWEVIKTRLRWFL